MLQDVNDNSPVFNEVYTANVSVGALVGTVVKKVEVSDKDTVSISLQT